MSKFLTILKQGFNYPKNFIAGRLRESTAKLSDLKSGEGAILEVRGKKLRFTKIMGERWSIFLRFASILVVL